MLAGRAASAQARAGRARAAAPSRPPTVLALSAGDVLAGAGDGDWAVAHRSRLEEVRSALLEDLLAARVELGGGGDVVGELEALVVEHPLREGLWALLITALYRAGRQADALAAYARVRTALVERARPRARPGPAGRSRPRSCDQSRGLGRRDGPTVGRAAGRREPAAARPRWSAGTPTATRWWRSWPTSTAW